jgi:hypothetical protein
LIHGFSSQLNGLSITSVFIEAQEHYHNLTKKSAILGFAENRKIKKPPFRWKWRLSRLPEVLA